MDFRLQLRIPLALGNGTRPAREPLAVLLIPDGIDPADLVGLAWSAVGPPGYGWLPPGVTIRPASGVEPREVLHALRSPHHELVGERPAEPAATEVRVEKIAERARGRRRKPAAREWRSVPVGQMDFGPASEAIRAVVLAAGMQTAGDLEDEGNAEGGLTHVAGVTSEYEAAIARALARLADQAG